MKTKTQQIISLIIALCAGIMAMEDQIRALGVVHPQIAMWWPMVLVASTLVSRIAAIIADWLKEQEEKVKAVLAMLALASLTACSGSGEGGRWTPEDTAAAMGTINQGVDTYHRIANPEYYYQPRPTVIVP